MAEKSDYTIEALLRGLHVLSLFGRERSHLSLTDIQRAAGLNKSTAFRVVSTLESAGYLERDLQTKLYRPGLKVLQLGFAAISSLEFRRVARPFLEQLRADTGESASLGVLDGMEVVYVDRIRGQQIVGVVLGLGSRIPAHCASMGKVILAHLPPEEVKRRLMEIEIKPCTSQTQVDLQKIQDELRRVCTVGYAINNEELEVGLRAVAAPIFDHQGAAVAAINISGSVRTISRQRLVDDLAPRVVQAAMQISQTLGHSAR